MKFQTLVAASLIAGMQSNPTIPRTNPITPQATDPIASSRPSLGFD